MTKLSVDQAALASALEAFTPQTAQEARDVERVRALVGRTDPWSRASPLHVTGSALVLTPASARVLMRWHPRMKRWMQVGGHADAGEADPWAVALREAREETGLTDLQAWPPRLGRTPVQLTIVGVPAGHGEPAHEHADIRYLFSTEEPERARSEASDAPVRWCALDRAIADTGEANLKELLRRIDVLLGEHEDRP